ncbi:ABC transporter [Embleya hyalina]|uniref:ABC transporter n=1 Tax=Embleya hyalina TaxID=516124 RepID=A0A401YQH2_9ACTN|nr:ABC transporter [Embleya hyalina]
MNAGPDRGLPGEHESPIPPRARLRASNLELAYGDRTVVRDLDLDIPEGSVTAIIGPNGCGKSTLLRAFGRLLRPRKGTVLLDGRPIHAIARRQVAELVGFLPQSPVAPEGITVADLVARGRHPHQSWYRRWSSDDESAVERALRRTGMYELAERPMEELSGRQRQRAWIAMTLAQETGLLLLDEPTTHLDLAHQIDVLDLVEELHAETNRTVVMVLHELSLAARYATRLVAMKDGRVVAQGTPRDVLTEDMLLDVFALRARIRHDDETGSIVVVPLGRRPPRRTLIVSPADPRRRDSDPQGLGLGPLTAAAPSARGRPTATADGGAVGWGESARPAALACGWATAEQSNRTCEGGGWTRRQAWAQPGFASGQLPGRGRVSWVRTVRIAKTRMTMRPGWNCRARQAG